MDEVERTRRLLAGTNPVPEQALEGVASRPHATGLRRRLLDTPRDPSVPLGTEPGGRPHHLRLPRQGVVAVLVTAGVAAIIVMVAVLVPWSPTGTAVAGTPPILDYGLVGDVPFGEATGQPSGSELIGLAVAASGRTVVPRSGPIAYVRTDNWFFSATVDANGSSQSVRPTAVESWTAPDGSSVRHERAGPPLLLEGSLPLGMGSGALTTESFPAGSEIRPNAEVLARAGAAGLRATLLAETGCSVPGQSDATCLLQGVAMVHDQQIVPPSIDSDLWRMLAAEKDLVTLGDVVDRAGRPAVAITTSLTVAAPVRWVLLIDPQTGSLLGTELIAMDPHAGYVVAVPAVVGFTAYLASGWASSVPS